MATTTTEAGGMKRKLPDDTAHQPPAAMFILGGIAVLLGVAGNCWQVFTTFSGFWSMFNPNGSRIDAGREPIEFLVCAIIALSSQLALLMLVFRIDRTWKNTKVSSGAAGKIKIVAVEIVQQVDIVLIWGVIGFVADTIGDYTFITMYTASLDVVTSVFIVFMYAASLYALSTISLVRGIEYIWAGFVAAAHFKAYKESLNHN